MPLFGRKETAEEERARRAHEEIDAADAAAQAALEHGQQARAHARAIADEDLRAAQTHVEETVQRERERVAAVTDEATAEARRAIDKAEERAAAKIANSEHAAEEAIERARTTAQELQTGATSRAADLREHAGVPLGDVQAGAQPTAPGWYEDPHREAPFRWWDGATWTGRLGGPS